MLQVVQPPAQEVIHQIEHQGHRGGDQHSDGHIKPEEPQVWIAPNPMGLRQCGWGVIAQLHRTGTKPKIALREKQVPNETL